MLVAGGREHEVDLLPAAVGEHHVVAVEPFDVGLAMQSPWLR